MPTGKCKPTTQVLPAVCAWLLLLISTAIFFGCASQFLATHYSPVILVYEGILSVFVVVNFGLATFMDPGTYPRATEDEVKAGGETRAPLYKSIDIHGVSMRMKWCATCQFYRPPRCSHCSVCNSCIEVFDHHCPWVNNCIGRSNYRFFVQFLISLTIDMFSIFAFSLVYVVSNKDSIVSPNNILLIIVMVIVGITCIPVIGLTCFHMVLISRGRTTNEQVTGKMKGGHNPFNRGCLVNFQFALCGPIWPRLRGRKSQTYSFDPDKIKMIYQTNVNRVYMEVNSNGVAKSNGGIGAGDHSLSIDSNVEHSTPFVSPRDTSFTFPAVTKDPSVGSHQYDDVPLGGSAHSLTSRSVGTTQPATGGGNGVRLFVSSRQQLYHPRLYSTGSTGQPDIIGASRMFTSVAQPREPPQRLWSVPVGSTVHRTAPIASSEELTPSPTTTAFNQPLGAPLHRGTVASSRGGAMVKPASMRIGDGGPGRGAMTTSAITAFYQPPGRVVTAATSGELSAADMSRQHRDSSRLKRPGKVKPTQAHPGYVNYSSSRDDGRLGEPRVGDVGVVPGSVRRPRSFTRALETSDELTVVGGASDSHQFGSRDRLQARVNEEGGEDNSSHSILEISV